MLILLISTIWLAALVLVVAACQIAARGDRVVPARMERSPRLLEDGASWGKALLSLKLEDRRAKPAPANSKPTASEHVRNRSQADLYVRP
jgi:hypothetical protein